MNNSSFQTHYSYYELGLSAQIGSPLQVNKLWIKPFIGIDYMFGLQSAFKESITSSTTSATINAPLWTIHTPQLTLGTQMQVQAPHNIHILVHAHFNTHVDI